MGIKELGKDILVRARETFHVGDVVVLKGALARVGHAIVQEREHLFEELKADFEHGDAAAKALEAAAKARAAAAEAAAVNEVKDVEQKAAEIADAVVPAVKQGAAGVAAAAKAAASKAKA